MSHYARANGLMESRVSHIYREGNVPADILSNVVISCPTFTGCPRVTLAVVAAVNHNLMGRPSYRFS